MCRLIQLMYLYERFDVELPVRLVSGCITSCFPMKVALLRHRVAMTRIRTTAGQLGPKDRGLLQPRCAKLNDLQ